MKAIFIDNCEDCPLCHYSRQKAYCNSAVTVINREFKERYLGEILSKPKIPDWCPLDDVMEQIVGLLLQLNHKETTGEKK